MNRSARRDVSEDSSAEGGWWSDATRRRRRRGDLPRARPDAPAGRLAGDELTPTGWTTSCRRRSCASGARLPRPTTSAPTSSPRPDTSSSTSTAPPGVGRSRPASSTCPRPSPPSTGPSTRCSSRRPSARLQPTHREVVQLSLLRKALGGRDRQPRGGARGHREVPRLLRRAQPARHPGRDGGDPMTVDQNQHEQLHQSPRRLPPRGPVRR